MQEKLERWRFALKRRGIKLHHNNTEYVCQQETPKWKNGVVRRIDKEVPYFLNCLTGT